MSESLRPSRRYEQTPDDHTLCTGLDGCGCLVRDRRAHDVWHHRTDAVEAALRIALKTAVGARPGNGLEPWECRCGYRNVGEVSRCARCGTTYLLGTYREAGTA